MMGLTFPLSFSFHSRGVINESSIFHCSVQYCRRLNVMISFISYVPVHYSSYNNIDSCDCDLKTLSMLSQKSIKLSQNLYANEISRQFILTYHSDVEAKVMVDKILKSILKRQIPFLVCSTTTRNNMTFIYNYNQ